MMKKLGKMIVVFLGTIFILAACGTNSSGKDNSDGKIQVVTTFTILEDMVNEIGGDQVEVYNLVPIGTDPHEYEPLPEDIKKASDADAYFIMG